MQNLFKNYNPTSPMRDYTETPNIIEQGVVSPEALKRIEKAEKGELKAKLAAILDRGIVEDRLTVDLPSHLHGEWVRNDPLEIKRLETLGFTIDREYANKRSIHTDGSDSAIVGDVIHMICPREIKEVIDEIRHEQVIKQHAKKTIKGKEMNKEEIDLLTNIQHEGDSSVHAFSNSHERSAGNKDLADILQSIDNQAEPYDTD